MNRPYKYSVFRKQADGSIKFLWEKDILSAYDQNNDLVIYEDTRYKAKLRLFYYLHPERKLKPYKPFEGTEIGKSIPILNF